jgi:hypothetical protein
MNRLTRRILIGSGIFGAAVIVSLAGLFAFNAGARHTANILGSDDYRAKWLTQISTDLEYRKNQIAVFPIFFKISGRPLTTQLVEASLKAQQEVEINWDVTKLVDNWDALAAELQTADFQENSFVPKTKPIYENNRDAFYALLGSNFAFELRENRTYRACITGKFVWFTNYPSTQGNWIPLPNLFNSFRGEKTEAALNNPAVAKFLKIDTDPDGIDPTIPWASPSGFVEPLLKSGSISFPDYKVCGEWHSL